MEGDHERDERSREGQRIMGWKAGKTHVALAEAGRRQQQ
jgi:hypothetical protein